MFICIFSGFCKSLSSFIFMQKLSMCLIRVMVSYGKLDLCYGKLDLGFYLYVMLLCMDV